MRGMQNVYLKNVSMEAKFVTSLRPRDERVLRPRYRA